MKKPALGVVVAGKYKLESLLSEGGMGSLWIASHLDLDIKVAIKFLLPEFVSSDVLRKRFAQEAKTAARIQSKHVIDIKDYGIDDDLPYITMELLRGESLRSRLDQRGRLPLSEALRYLTQIVNALEDTHKIGIVHRDLKPDNIFICSDGVDEIVKLLDFGIAKWSQQMLTETGTVLGTLGYMSPEQLQGQKNIDVRSDLWSLAVVLYEMITGRGAFEVSTDIAAHIRRIVSEPAPPATAVASDLPPALDSFFLRALSRDPSQRFQRASELLGAFAHIVGTHAAAPPPAYYQMDQRGVVDSTSPTLQAGANPPFPARGQPAQHETLPYDVDYPTLRRPSGRPQTDEATTRAILQGGTVPLLLVNKAPNLGAAPSTAPTTAGPRATEPLLLVSKNMAHRQAVLGGPDGSGEPLKRPPRDAKPEPSAADARANPPAGVRLGDAMDHARSALPKKDRPLYLIVGLITLITLATAILLARLLF